MSRKKKALLIGLDGATFDLLMPWIRKGKLPFLRKLISEGVYGDLESTVPTISAAAWASLVTGKNPGKHGVFDFVTSEGRIINSTCVKSQKLWGVLSEYGLNCCVVNVPVTYPPDKIKGYMISSFLTPPGRKDFVFPPSLIETLTENKYKIDIEFEKYGMIPEGVERRLEDFRWNMLQGIYDTLKRRCNTVLDLIGKRKWDFLMVVFRETDLIQHLFWDEMDVMLRFYQSLDDCTNAIVDHFRISCCGKKDDVLLLLLSDHGFGKDCEKIFNVRAWLASQGRIFNESLLPRIYKKAYKKLAETCKWVTIHKSSRKLNSIISISSFQLKLKIGMHGIYISKLKFNTKRAYIEFRDALIDKLRAVKDPETGNRVFLGVWKREDVFEGPYLHQLPDVVYRTRPQYIAQDKEGTDLFQDHKGLPGGHISHPKGILIASGSLTRRGEKVENAHIYDIMPTILHFFSLPVSKDLDGKVLSGLFENKLTQETAKLHTSPKHRNENTRD